MDGFFSLKGKDAFFISALLGLVIYFAFMDGQEDQNKFVYFSIGFIFWLIAKYIYWSLRESSILKISAENLTLGLNEVEKVRKHDLYRAEVIEERIFNKYR